MAGASSMAATIVDGRYLDAEDNEFAVTVLEELEQFEERINRVNPDTAPPVLVFPALRGRQRYLIHALVQEQYPDLTTVSVGVEPHRRTTVYPHWATPPDTCAADTELSVKICEQPLKSQPRQERKPTSARDTVRKSNKEAVPHKKSTMPGDVETPTQPPAAHGRPQRRGKIAAEIYKPPAARQHRQPQQSSAARQQPRSAHYQKTTQALYTPQYGRPQNCHTPPQQPITNSSQGVTPLIEHPPSRTPLTSQRANSQLKPHSPSSPHQRRQHPTGRSPRSARRHPNAGGRPPPDRASCPPELAPSSTVHEEKPAASEAPHTAPAGNTNSSSQSNTEVKQSDASKTDTPQTSNPPSLRVPSSVESDNATNVVTTNANNPVSDTKHQPAPLISTTAPEPCNGTNSTTISSSNGNSADLRNYLDSKRQVEDQQIKSLSQTVDMLSNKYFNNTACPYNRVQNNVSTNDKFNQCRSSMNSRLNNMYENDSPRNGADPRGSYDDRHGGDYRRARPDQVLYVPRGRRNHAPDTGDMNHFNGSRSSPLTEHYHNSRPPSPAFSITSVVSEFSGRQRYEGGYGQSVSRPGSRLSIYDGDDDKVNSKPPYPGDRRNYSRESTPGYGKPGAARFNRQTLQLIERCINQDPSRPSSRNSYSGDVGNENDPCPTQEYYNSKMSNPSEQYRGDNCDRTSKSPTPNRDSIHSKENVMHPVESSPRRRRSRKNRKRRSQSRDHSFDCINKETGSLGNLYRGGVSGQNQPPSRLQQRPAADNGYTFYNSNIGRGEAPGTRGSSRNTSQERSGHEDWRQMKSVSHPGTPVKSASNPTSPTKSPYHGSNPSNRPSYPAPQSPTKSNDSYSSPPVVDPTYPQNTLVSRRNSVDKPPTGRPSCDSRRNSIGKVSSPTSSTPTSPTHAYPTPNILNINNSIQSPTNASERCSATPRLNGESPSTTSSAHTEPASPCVDTMAQSTVPSVKEEIEETADIGVDTPPPVQESIEPTTTVEESTIDDICSEYMSLDWAEESEKEDLRLRGLTNTDVPEEMSSTTPYHQEVITPARPQVDVNTQMAINTSIGQEATIERTRNDYSKYSSSPPQRQVYRPPQDRYSPPRRTNPSSPGRYSPPTTRPLHNSSSGSNSPSSGSNSPSTDHPLSRGDGSPGTPLSGLAHVLELYDFPSTLRTQDLVAAYQSYQSAASLDIKWVDDTHALAVFCTASVAAQAVTQPHALIKARLLADASPASKAKAARIDEALLPARPRPQTSMMLARRLLSGALGVRVNLTKEEREREAKALRQAKDHKRQVAKQREDVWEGNI